MAEIAVPLIALGSMYIMSKQKDKKIKSDIHGQAHSMEGYTNMTQTRNPLPGVNPPTPPYNFPLTEPVDSCNCLLMRQGSSWKRVKAIIYNIIYII